MAKDISNAYLVTTDAGDVMVNTGFMDNAERTKALLAPHRTAPFVTSCSPRRMPTIMAGCPPYASRDPGNR